MGLYDVPLFVSLLGFGMLANFHMWGIMLLLLRAVLNIIVRNTRPRGSMCFRCLMFNLSGPCDLLFWFVGSWSCGECYVISSYFICYSVGVSVCLVCCEFVNIWWNNSQYVLVLSIFCCWMLWLCLVWVVVLCWIAHVWYSKECACCACDPSVNLIVPSMFLVYFCMSEVISSLKSLRAGAHVLVSSCCLFVWFCILCGRIRACGCYASCPLICCACLPSVCL